MVENIVRKGEIACYKQFLLFPRCFPQRYNLVRQNAVLMGNRLTLIVSSQDLVLHFHDKSRAIQSHSICRLEIFRFCNLVKQLVVMAMGLKSWRLNH